MWQSHSRHARGTYRNSKHNDKNCVQSISSHGQLFRFLLGLLSMVYSPGILSPKVGQPVTNCNRRLFNAFWSRNMSSTTYQKSENLSRGRWLKTGFFRTLYNAAWKRGCLYYLLCRLSSMPRAAWASRERKSFSCFPDR